MAYAFNDDKSKADVISGLKGRFLRVTEEIDNPSAGYGWTGKYINFTSKYGIKWSELNKIFCVGWQMLQPSGSVSSGNRVYFTTDIDTGVSGTSFPKIYFDKYDTSSASNDDMGLRLSAYKVNNNTQTKLKVELLFIVMD